MPPIRPDRPGLTVSGCALIRTKAQRPRVPGLVFEGRKKVILAISLPCLKGADWPWIAVGASEERWHRESNLFGNIRDLLRSAKSNTGKPLSRHGGTRACPCHPPPISLGAGGVRDRNDGATERRRDRATERLGKEPPPARGASKGSFSRPQQFTRLRRARYVCSTWSFDPALGSEARDRREALDRRSPAKPGLPRLGGSRQNR